MFTKICVAVAFKLAISNAIDLSASRKNRDAEACKRIVPMKNPVLIGRRNKQVDASF